MDNQACFSISILFQEKPQIWWLMSETVEGLWNSQQAGRSNLTIESWAIAVGGTTIACILRTFPGGFFVCNNYILAIVDGSEAIAARAKYTHA